MSGQVTRPNYVKVKALDMDMNEQIYEGEGLLSLIHILEDGENGSMTVTDGVERKITLKEGDLIGIINTESEDSSLMLTAR